MAIDIFIDEKAVELGKQYLQLIGAEENDADIAVKAGQIFCMAGYEMETPERVIENLVNHGLSLDHYKVGVSSALNGRFSPWFPHNFNGSASSREVRLALEVLTLREQSDQKKQKEG